MKRPNHLTRWTAAGVIALVLTSAGTAAATTPTEPPEDTTMGTEGTAMSEGSEPMTGAGPSDCPAITATAGSEAPDATEAAGTEAPAGTDAAATTEAVEGTAEASASTEAMTETTMGADVSAPPAAGPFVQIVETDEYGPILVDANCFTLYAFSQDVDGESTCVDDCAATWPVLLLADETVPPLADELDPTLFSVVQHPDGPMLKIGDWPLYYFAGDANPGELNGQGVGGVWWVVAPDGTLIEGDAGGATDTTAAGSEPMDTGAAETTEG